MDRLSSAKTLRRENWSKLTFKPETNDGHLRWVNERLQIHISQSELKNRGSANLPSNGRPLIVEFDETNQELYDAILRWINMSRAIVHGDDCGIYLFPGQGVSSEDDYPVCDNTIYNSVYRFSTTYLTGLSWRPGGIGGVLRFGTHAVRHLIYIHVRKQDGDPVAAADAINDTADHAEALYWFRTPVEKSRRVSRILGSSKRKTKDRLAYETPPETFPWMSCI